MNLVSYFYLIFFLGSTFLLYTICPKKQKWIVLLGASSVFYFLSAGWRIIFLVATILSIYFGALWIDKIQQSFKLQKNDLDKQRKKSLREKTKKRKRLVLTAIVVFNLGLLALLKYYGFFSENMNSIFESLNLGATLPVRKFALPLGISFYTLQAVSYIVDVNRGKYRADRNLGRVALFMSFFPQMIEGPIGRYDVLANQFYEGHSFDYQNFTFALQRILWGLFKKAVIADRANAMVNVVFGNYHEYSGIVVILSVLLYTLQLYAEFTGAFDIIIGSGQLFGIHLQENFRQPFFATTVNDFWRRWHITLGAWLRDYVFYSISLSKGFQKLSKRSEKLVGKWIGKLLPVGFALFFVWLGNGLWHGAGWKYIFYGMYYYVVIMIGEVFTPLSRKIIGFLHINVNSKIYRIFQIARTFVIVNVGMLIFRADGLNAVRWMSSSAIKGIDFSVLSDGTLLKLGLDIYDFAVLAIGVLVLFTVSLIKERKGSIRLQISKKNVTVSWLIFIALIVSIIVLGAYGPGYDAVDLIYAQF